MSVAQVYDVWSRRRRVSLCEFKSRLARAWVAGQIDLARNDVPTLLGSEKRGRSEMRVGSQYLHFVIKTA